ncbi:Phage integrase family protein [Bradyrhizobium lablabi]|uniref:Phage integrase family protein n=1 Tax=Bradyrhizobium lablabi TaxID=722472 RepID=A0A1M6LMU0_9BRAD|nr:site-specific integrase [Bradyrhizobium lablabi]SHJ72465.1 Phage integrase family protein [Bradyrhizobium lablabi]
MPIKIYRRKGSNVWQYRGTVTGNRLRGSTGTANREIAARVASEIENRHWKRHLDGPEDTLTFPKAVALYLKAGKSERFVWKIEDYWKNAKVKDMTSGAIRQSAIDLYPKVSGATWNRCVIVPTQAIINHCAELELCPRIRVKRFPFDEKIKQPVTLEWLDAFCAHADKQLAALALFMFATGCRIAEARRIEWDDIDFQARTILIRKTKIRRQRLPNMPPRLLLALANMDRNCKPFGDAYTTLRDRWERVRVAAKLKRLTFHCSRHGFATKLLHDGIDVVTVAKLGGWASAQQVLKTYGHAKDNPKITDGLFDAPPDLSKKVSND